MVEAVSHARDTGNSWPTDRPTDEVIAERMLAAALLNYRRARQQRGIAAFKTWDEMDVVERGFYLTAIGTAEQAIWGGR